MSDWRQTTAYRHWKAQVLWRDRACVICNSKKNPNAHHVNHATYFPELRFDVDNGVTLCYPCHMNLHCNFHRSYRTKCDEYNFMNFVKLSTHLLGVWPNVMLKDEIPLTTAKAMMPNTCILAKFHEDMIVSYHTSPDSVVGYVTELATLRYPV